MLRVHHVHDSRLVTSHTALLAIYRPDDGKSSKRRTSLRVGGLLGLFQGSDAPVVDCPMYPELWDHLRTRGLPAQRLQVADVPGKGRALIVQNRVAKGQQLLEVPMDCALTPVRAVAESPLLQHMAAADSLPDWTLLAVFLAQLAAHHSTPIASPPPVANPPRSGPSAADAALPTSTAPIAPTGTARSTRRDNSDRSSRDAATAGSGEAAAQRGAAAPPAATGTSAEAAAGGVQGRQRAAHAAAGRAAESGLTADAAAAWGPYAAVLPAATGNVLEWPEELRRSMDSTSAGQLARDMCQTADEAWGQVEPLVAEAVANGTCSASVVTEDRFRWALAVVLSRVIRLRDEPPLDALIPWADFANHSPACSSFFSLSNTRQARADSAAPADAAAAMLRVAGESVVLRADREYQPGDEAAASYGEKSSGQLLVTYGFVPFAGTNPHDAHELRLQVSAADEYRDEKAQILRDHGLRSEEVFPMQWAGWPAPLLPYAAFVECRPKDAADLAPLALMLFRDGQFPLLDGADMLAAAQNAVVAALERTRRRLSVDGDERRAAMLPRISDASTGERPPLSPRQYVECAQSAVRLREKQIVGRSIRLVQAE
eukprot:jgi/Ulvmu1/6673/UM030_0004.1